MPKAPETSITGEQFWLNKNSRQTRPDGPSNVNLTNPERRMLTWTRNGDSVGFLLYSPNSFYYARRRGKTWEKKRLGDF